MANVIKFPKAFEPRDKNRPLDYKVEISNAKLQVADVFLYDMIGGWGITAENFARDLKALGDVKTINLHINSDGGDVFDGRAIFSLLVQHSARVITHVDGLAASIASLIALAGNEVRMADGSFFMIHNAWGVGIGDSKELRKLADLLDSVNNSIIDTYQSRSKQSREDIISWMDSETWMTATEAKDRGFADVVAEPLKVAACLQDPYSFKRPPSALMPNRVSALSAIQKAKEIISISSSVKTGG
jgi:ATP-dependent Clp protease protease subunit